MEKHDTPRDPVGAAEDAVIDAAAALERAAEWLRNARRRQLATQAEQAARIARKIEAALSKGEVA